MELRSAELRDEIAERLGSGVEPMKLEHGTLDEASITVIGLTTLARRRE